MRIQVNLSKEMISKLDMYAKYQGVSRSALCALFIGQGVMGFDKAMEFFEISTKEVKTDEE